MPIATVDDIVAGLAASQMQRFMKVGVPVKAIGSYESGWMLAGIPGAGGASPAYNAGSGYTCDRTTLGALAYTNGAVQNWLAKLFGNSSVVGTLVVADRLWSCSGMGFAAGTYTVTTPGALPARITDSGVGCELWVEQFVAAGAATGTLTANYLNTLGQAKAGVIGTVVSAPLISQAQPVPLQVGDTGISQLTSIVTNQTWTSGTFGATILKRLAELELPIPGVGKTLDWASLGLPRIPNDACLMFLWAGSAVTSPFILGKADIIDK